jgi:isoleucyl-tRNA synthetase
MLAPVLPVTADELWRHLPGRREESVHMAEFPARDAIKALLNDGLVSRWERLIAIRDRVNVALEAKRQDKTIGTSLAAHVTLRASGDALTLLERYRDDLPMLFIVSAVNLEPGGSADLEVDVRRAEGHKCARCWRIVPAVSTSPATEGLCDRCVGAVTAAA